MSDTSHLTGSTGFGNSSQNNYMSGLFNMQNFDWKGAVSSGYGMLYNNVPTPHSNLNSNNQDSANIRSGISQGLLNAGLQSGNPYLAAAGVAYGVIDKTGGFNDASVSLDSTSNAINKVGSIALPGAGWFLPSTKKYKRSQAAMDMSSGYSGFNDFASKVEQDAGGKFLTGSSKINNNVDKASMMDASIQNIKTNRDNDFTSMYSMTQSIGTGNQFALNGGYNSQYAVAAKHGLKLESLNWAKSLKNLNTEVTQVLSSTNIPEFKQGGSFNVIPDGALHKNKHHMEDAEGLTKKGIPVVTEENGELIQQAEIEREEVILHLSLTEKLESMLKDYEEADSQQKKDQISINAGKLLVKELLHNTVDNTGLLAS